MKPNVKRLRAVIAANEGRDPDAFTMYRIGYRGSPGCLLGGFFDSGKDRRFSFDSESSSILDRGDYVFWDADAVMAYFGLSWKAFCWLFGPDEEQPSTLKEALDRVRDFIADVESGRKPRIGTR